jgi:hypothetical protein
MSESMRSRFASAASPILAGLALSLVGCDANDVALGGPGTLVRVDPVAAGASCEEGGVAIHTGFDDDDDLYLDDGEIEGTQFACNGTAPVQCNGGTIATGPLTIGSADDWAALDGVHCVDGDLFVTGLDATIDDRPDLTVVTGDLVIARNPGLPSLAALGHVKYVGGQLVVQSNDALTDLAGLTAVVRADALRIVGNSALMSLTGLEHVNHFGGEIQIENNGALTSLAGLHNLTTAGIVAIRSNRSLTDLTALASLKSVAQLEIGGHRALARVDLPALERSDNRVVIENNAALTELAAPALITTGSTINVSGNALVTVDLGGVVTAGAVIVMGEPDLATLSLPQLTYVTGPVELRTMPALAELDLGGLRSIGGRLFAYQMPRLSSLGGLDKLEAIGGDLVVQENAGLVGFNGLGALGLVGGDMIVRDNNALTSLAGLSAMTEIGGTLAFANNPRLPTAQIDAFRNRVQVGP